MLKVYISASKSSGVQRKGSFIKKVGSQQFENEQK